MSLLIIMTFMFMIGLGVMMVVEGKTPEAQKQVNKASYIIMAPPALYAIIMWIFF